MSYPLVIRLMLAMALMPDASYREALARLAGLLVDIPFTLKWHVPAEKVVTGWRLPVTADVIEDVFWASAGPLIEDDEPSAVLLAGRTACAADGMLVNVSDTPENRAEFGCTGTAEESGEDAAPFPQLRIVAVTARGGRACWGDLRARGPGSRTRQEGGTARASGTPRPVEPRAAPPQHAGKNHARTPNGNRLQDTYRTYEPRKSETPKSPWCWLYAAIVLFYG